MAQKPYGPYGVSMKKKTIISHRLPQWLCSSNDRIKITKPKENTRGKHERTVALLLSITKVSMWFILCVCVCVVHSDRYIYNIYIIVYRYIT